MSAPAAPRPALSDESWHTYRYLADNAIDIVLEADLHTRMRWVSPSVEEVLGWRPEELVGQYAADIVHPDDMADVGVMVTALNERRETVRSARVRLQRKDGIWKALRLRGRAALDADDLVVGHIITFQDTTERDDALRALSVLSEGNRVLARVDGEDDLLQQMCEAIVTSGQYPLAWYGRKVDDESKSVEQRARAGAALAYVRDIRVSWGDNPLGAGPTGRSLRTSTTQIQHDFRGDPGFAPWLAAAERAGLRSSISLPVTVAGVVDGVLCVYAEESYAFDSRARSLLETLASDLGLGLHRIRSVRALQDTTREVEVQNARLRGVFDSQFDPFVLLESVRDEPGTLVDLRYVAVSEATLDYNRLTRDQMIGRTIVELFPGQRDDGSLAAYFAVIETGVPLALDDVEYFHEPRQELVRLDIRAVRSGDGVAITFRDVTRRHEVATALIDSEERYRILAEHATDVVWQAEPDVGITWSSESIRVVLGWEPRDVVGRAFDLVHEADREPALKNLEGLARGAIVEGEARVACKDGSWKWVAYTASRATVGERIVDIASLHDIDDEVRARQALDFALGHDPLTGMAARPAMLQRLGELLGTQTGRRLVAVLCVGVDRLAAVNEALTHAAGDLVLTTVATRIAETVGKPDLLGRGTGVEFLVLLPQLTSGDEAVSLAQRILSATKAPVVVGDEVIEPTVSIGIAIGDRTSDREQLARDASTAMGQAKADGRDRYVFADASMADLARHRLDVERRIREALDEDRFVAHFQPVVDLATGSLVGYEALVRGQRSDGTLAPPSHFIPVAELSPVIADIDLVMLRQSLAVLQHLPEQVTVAVNLSTVTLTRPGYPQLIERAIRSTEVRASRLHLEVTETALLGDSGLVVESMAAIARLGPRWYVDDFGTGFSSISHLRDLPVSGLKLDVSFAAGIRDGDQTSLRLAQGLAGLAGGLGLDTVAEGIETENEAAVLRAQGWRHGQGWLYGKAGPLP